MGTRAPKLALIISSYSRVPDLLRQVYSMAYGQSYKDTHLFVSVKGIPESTYRELVEPQVYPLVKSRKLSIRWTGNTNQMWNFLDTVTDCDIAPYDLFCKIDDDDYYHPDYLKYCAAALEMAPKGASTYVTGNFPTCKNEHETWYNVPTFSPGSYFSGWGNMLGISNEVFHHILEARDDIAILASDSKKFNWKDGLNIGWREDRYYFECMQYYGPCVDISLLFTHAGITPSIVGGHTLAGSLTRNKDFYKSEFFGSVSNLRMTNGHPPVSWIVETTDGKILRIFKGTASDVLTGEEFPNTEYKDGEVKLTGRFRYLRRTDGKYQRV